MATPSESSQNKPGYFIQDTGAEMARLIEQDRLFTKTMGGLLPERSDQSLSDLHRVLDVACGPGGWALDLAQQYPHIEVFGFDISDRMIDYANAQASAGRLDNATFTVRDVLDPLDFPDHFFDLVNARYLAVIPTSAWPRVIQELVRITRPGGTIRLTENDQYSVTNKPAFEALSGMFLRALKVAGQSFSPDARHACLTPMLGYFLREAGCTHIQRKPHVIDWSAGTEEHGPISKDFRVVLKLLQPFLIKTGATTPEEADRLYHEAEMEMLAPDFCALWYFLTVWGETP
jgi:SAM-dependent methyltransferase